MPPADENIVDIGLAEVARRLSHKTRWLQTQLAEDKRSQHPRLQHHHYIGRKPLWTEREFRMLRAALIAVEKEKRNRPASTSSSATATGTSTEPTVFEDAKNACDAVLGFRPGKTPGKPLSKSSARSKPNSSMKSSTGSSRRSRLGLRLVNT
jgi:hypothetical protein